MVTISAGLFVSQWSNPMATILIRPHPTKNKPLVTPVYTLAKLNELMKQEPKPQVVFPKKNISSGEDCVIV